MTSKLIFYYISWSIRLRIPAWYYFQINAEWYNKKKGLYSKIDIDQYIPKQWLLKQEYFTKDSLVNNFPVFLKPEWGQNANGIVRIDSVNELESFSIENQKLPYIIQEAAKENIEYEIFYIRGNEETNNYPILTITYALNTTQGQYPINHIRNKNVKYLDCTSDFSHNELEKVKSILDKLPPFRIARVSLKTNSKEELLEELFHIIEINLFAPFPINLLDENTSQTDKDIFIKKATCALVKVSANIPKKHFNNFVFTKKIIRHYQTKGLL
jgi:hypothetical protein